MVKEFGGGAPKSLIQTLSFCCMLLKENSTLPRYGLKYGPMSIVWLSPFHVRILGTEEIHTTSESRP